MRDEDMTVYAVLKKQRGVPQKRASSEMFPYFVQSELQRQKYQRV